MNNTITKEIRYVTWDGVEHKTEQDALVHLDFHATLDKIYELTNDIDEDGAIAIVHWIRNSFVRKEL